MIDEDVFSFLLAKVEETKKAHQEAKKNFWAVAGKPRELPKVPTSFPHPDGNELMRSVVAEENRALKAHIEAMTRLNQYLLNGTLPDEVPAQFRKTKTMTAGKS